MTWNRTSRHWSTSTGVFLVNAKPEALPTLSNGRILGMFAGGLLKTQEEYDRHMATFGEATVNRYALDTALVQIFDFGKLWAFYDEADMVTKILSLGKLFKGRHFEREIIILCVRWYLRYKLSYRDLVEMMAERGLAVAHTTIMRWLQRFVPEFEKRWNRYARMSGRSWRVDETYVKIRGQWVYLYRAVDRDGNTVDFRLSRKRDVTAAKAFLRRALKTQGRAPLSITLDGYAASHRAVREMPTEDMIWKDTKLRSSKYLNNMIEQDHRDVKSRIAPMLDFKVFKRAAMTIAGIELLRRIHKGQFVLDHLGVQGQTAPAIWNAVLAD
jgi:transposase-like protein